MRESRVKYVDVPLRFLQGRDGSDKGLGGGSSISAAASREFFPALATLLGPRLYSLATRKQEVSNMKAFLTLQSVFFPVKVYLKSVCMQERENEGMNESSIHCFPLHVFTGSLPKWP